MKKSILLGFMLVLAYAFNDALAQERTVSGKVTSVEDGSALPGVNVVLKGTTSGTVTDIDGNFTLLVPSDGGILVFSFIGLSTEEVEIGARSVINIQMTADVKQLSEVIVTGYGTETKRDITGSISQIKSEEIEQLAMQSFDRAIQGRVAGVQIQSQSGQPGGNMSFNIRGQGSTTSNAPLFIVDGIQIISGSIAGQASNNALSGLNPEDIASIEVLKDAAAAAIYGAQAANGVVIITTKRGQKGKTDFQVSYQGGFTEAIDRYDVLNAQQYAELREEAFVNAGLRAEDANAIFGNPRNPESLTDFDWVDAFLRRGQLHSVNARLSGGTDKTTFYISASYEMQEAFTLESDWERQSLRANIVHEATDRLTIGTNIGLTRQNQFGSISNGNFVNGPFVATYSSQPNSPAFDENGDFNVYPAHFPSTSRGHLFNYNILEGVTDERRENFVGQVQANMNINYKISDDFTFNVVGGIDWADTESINERPATIPVFSGFGGQSTYDNRRTLVINGNSTLNYNRSFGDHSVSGILGVEVRRFHFEDQVATGRGFPNPALRLLDDAANPQSVAGGKTENTRAGAFGRANYNYKNKYYISGTLRRDGSSRFGEQNRFGTFWSIGSSWRIIEESFAQNTTFLDDLKLRFSYGVLGNSNGIDDYEAIPSFSGDRQYLGLGGQVLNIANDQLSWERSQQLNIGVDFAFLGSRISGSFDVFRNDTQDQLFDVPLALESGFDEVRSNVGEIRNEGIEIAINSVNVNTGGFKWTTSFNITFLNNEVLSLPGGVDSLALNTDNQLIVGQPIDFLWGLDFVGVNPANGKEAYRTRDGRIIYGNAGLDDGYIIGSAIPTSFGGLVNTFTYKGLSLDVFFQYQFGHDAYLGDFENLAISGADDNNQLVSQMDRWQNPGDVTSVPIAIEGGVVDGFGQADPGVGLTSRYVSDAGYIRLKQVTLGYELPEGLVSRTGLSGIRVFVQGLNLATITNFEGIDPEVVASNNDRDVSSFGAFPVGRQYTAGITLDF